MSGKEFYKSMLLSFFIIVTLVNIATFLLGTVFVPDAKFGYEAFLSPLIYGLFSLIPFAIMYSKKELSTKQLLIRKVFQLLSIEVLLGFLAFGFHSDANQNFMLKIAYFMSIFVVYVLVHFFIWILDVQSAKKMNQDLFWYQNHEKKK